MSEAPAPTDPAEQLEALGQRLASSNPDLYRHLALYLQVLREILPGRVDQAVFHLATQVHPLRYARLPSSRRLQLHQRLRQLTDRCLSLLTVEQLAALAAQMERERRRRGMAEEPSELTALQAEAAFEGGGPAGPDAPAEGEGGSVRLDLKPPISGGWLGWSPAEDTPPQRPKVEGDDEPAEPLEPEPFQGADEPSPWHGGELPREPHRLLRWIDGMERALTRRLRNLSHALNVELLRTGLSDGLLPVSLLDAVLQGQLEPQAAPPNLLRLPLPIPGPGGSSPLQALAVLLRCADLELEEPRLRTCRRRWQQHRLQVRTMARQFRLLQRRLQAREAERLWLQDIRRSHREP